MCIIKIPLGIETICFHNYLFKNILQTTAAIVLM